MEMSYSELCFEIAEPHLSVICVWSQTLKCITHRIHVWYIC